jgi:type I restriction enzyme S subunit
MGRMRKMGYDVIPQGWAKAKLRDVCDVVKKQVDPSQYPEQTFNYLSIENIEPNTGRLTKFSPTLGRNIRSTKLAFAPGDILYSKLRPYLNKVYSPQFEGVSATDLIPLRPRPGIARDFLAHYLRTQDVTNYASSHMRGIQLPRLPIEELMSIEIPLPPSREQGRIVSKMDELLSALRIARESVQKVPNLMRQFRRSVLASAFRGKLTGRDSGDEQASDLLGEDLTDVLSSPSRAEEPLPLGWEWMRVRDIADVRLGKQRSPRNRPGKYAKKYIRVANVFRDRIDLHDVKEMDFPPPESERYRLRKGDLLLCEGQSPELVGRCAIWNDEVPECCFQNTLIRVRSSTVIPRYLLHVFAYAADKGDFAELATQGVNIAHLGATRLAEYRIPLAPRQEQSRIVEAIDSLFEEGKVVEDRAGMALAMTNQLEQAILSEAFRGQLVLQDPNDEPATVLLGRIRNQDTKRQGRKGSRTS